MACPPLFFCVNCQPFSYDKEMFNLKVIIMNRKLQFLMMLLLMIGGVTSAWGKVIYPNNMHNFRTNNATPTAWDSGDWANPITNKDGSNLETVEVNTQSARIWAIEQFVIPNIDHVTSISITQKKKSGNNAAIWYFPYDYPTENAYNSAYIDNVKSVLGVYPGAEYTNSPTIDDVSGTAVSLGDIETIKTKFATYITDNTLTLNLLLTTKAGANSQGLFYTQKEDNGNNRPYITVTYDYAVYNATTSTGYSSLNEAMNAATSSADIYLYDDCVIGARATTQTTGITLNIIPKADVTITASHNRGDMWILGNKSGTTLNIGSDDNKITFQSTGSSRIILNNVCAAEAGAMNLTNIVFDNIQFSGEASNKIGKAIYYKSGASGTLRNVSFKNCTISDAANAEYTPKAFIYSEDTANDKLYLDKSLNFDSDCSTPHIYAKGRMRMTEADRASFTCDEPIQILWGGSTDIGTNVIVRINGDYKDAFQLANGDYMSLAINTNNWTDLYITQSYSLTVSAAGAATLVLPFASKIPTGATCYTLKHTDGSSVVTATEVTGGTLAANTPVYVEANEGSYKFVTTATSGAPATGSDPVTYYALTGVFSQQTFGTEITSYDNLYILNKINEKVGFYKAANGLKVGANRCYLTATNVPGPAAARGLEISFDDEVTGLNEVRGKKEEVRSDYFNLAGQRVAQPTKGLYIVNGKKVIVK